MIDLESRGLVLYCDRLLTAASI